MYPRYFVLKRILLASVLGLLLGALTTELPFLLSPGTARAPREITLTIPAGTAEQVARGEQPPSIPQNMTFVVGDKLIVDNQDSVEHKLGPLWIPAKSKAQLSLDQEAKLSYECSFQRGKIFGLDVQEPITTGTRIFGIVYIAFPLAILIALYSILFAPKKKENVPA